MGFSFSFGMGPQTSHPHPFAHPSSNTDITIAAGPSTPRPFPVRTATFAYPRHPNMPMGETSNFNHTGQSSGININHSTRPSSPSNSHKRKL